MMRTCLSWIQRCPHGAILRHLLNMVNSFLYSFNNYFGNRLLSNDLIIIRNHGDDEEDERDIKRVSERQEDVHIKVEIQSNWEFQSLTSSPTRSPGLPWLKIDVQDTYKVGFRRFTYARKEDEIKFPMALVPGPTKIGFDENCQNKFNIQSPTHPGAIHIKIDARVAYDIQLGLCWTPCKGKEIKCPME
jgi:hypothetical protein